MNLRIICHIHTIIFKGVVFSISANSYIGCSSSLRLGYRDCICPNCSCELDLIDDERTSKKVHCPECEALIDLEVNPPKILNKENYVELLSSLNQGDIAIIKSILDDSEIDYYVFGENFLGVDPLIQPARFFVNQNQIDEAKEVLKDFQLNIWGTSKNQDSDD